jgi:hypothetical protein
VIQKEIWPIESKFAAVESVKTMAKISWCMLQTTSKRFATTFGPRPENLHRRKSSG